MGALVATDGYILFVRAPLHRSLWWLPRFLQYGLPLAFAFSKLASYCSTLFVLVRAQALVSSRGTASHCSRHLLQLPLHLWTNFVLFK